MGIIYMINGDKQNAVKFLNAAIDEDNYYAKIANEEPLFITIKSLINYPTIDEEDYIKKESMLSEKERKIKNHLEATYRLSGKLSKNELKMKKISTEKTSEKEKTIEKDINKE